jgi:hypothetical protein
MTTSTPPLTAKPRLLIEALYSYADDREDRLTESELRVAMGAQANNPAT